MTENITVTINVDGVPWHEIDMGDPAAHPAYRGDLTWYRRESKAPYSITVQISRNRKIPPEMVPALVPGPDPRKTLRASATATKQQKLEL